jgi:Ni/Fe-hydrogenase subunit HybB-like protein
MSETKTKLSAWQGSVVVLSLLLFFFAVPHTLEDFALGEPAKNGVPAVVLSLIVAGMSALQGLALFWAGQKDRRNYFIHAGLGIFWALASGIAQLPVILTTSDYRSGFMSLAYVVGMIAIGILLFVTSLQALRISGKPQVKNAVE